MRRELISPSAASIRRWELLSSFRVGRNERCSHLLVLIMVILVSPRVRRKHRKSARFCPLLSTSSWSPGFSRFFPFRPAQSNYQSSGSGGGSGAFDDPLTFNGAFAGTPTYTSDTSREDYYHYQANSNNGGTGSAYTSSSTNATNDAITNLHTDGWGADPGPSYGGSGTATNDTYNSGGSVIDWQSASWCRRRATTRGFR